MKILTIPTTELWIPAIGLFGIRSQSYEQLNNFQFPKILNVNINSLKNYKLIKHNVHTKYGLQLIKNNQCGFLFINFINNQLTTEWIEINTKKFSYPKLCNDFVMLDNNEIWSIKNKQLLPKFNNIPKDIEIFAQLP